MIERLSRRLIPDDADPIQRQRAYILVLVFVASVIANPVHVVVAVLQGRLANAIAGAITGLLVGMAFFLAIRRLVSVVTSQLVLATSAVVTVAVYLAEEEFQAYHAVLVAFMATAMYIMNMPDLLTHAVNALLYIVLTISATVYAFDDTVATITTKDLPVLYLSLVLLFAMMVFVVRGRRLLDGEYRKKIQFVNQQQEFEAAMQQFLFHELRNPLVVAQGALREAGNIAGHRPSAEGSGSGGMQPGPRAEGMQEHLVPMETLLHEGLRATHSMEKLLTDVQTVLQLRAGEYNVVCEEVAVQTIVQAVLGEVEENGVPLSVEWRGGEAMSTSVKTDHGALVRVLRHLLTNAMKFGRSNARMIISLSDGRVDSGEEQRQIAMDGHRCVSIEVRNDGAGMDEAAVAEAFDIFQVRSHRRGGGSGLGLVECKLLTEAIGVGLTLTSIVEGDTSAVMRVPLWDDERDGDLNEGEQMSSPRMLRVVAVRNNEHANSEARGDNNPLQVLGNGAGEKRLRVLFVDDVPMNRVVGVRLLMATMEPKPLVDVAGDGKEAVAKFKDAMESMESDSRYDVVFMDVTMPVMNGWEATEEIRKMERDHGVDGPGEKRCVVVAVTGNTLPADVERSLEAGMDDVFFKPYKVECFRAVMQAALDQ